MSPLNLLTARHYRDAISACSPRPAFRHLYPPLVLPLRQEGTHTRRHTDIPSDQASTSPADTTPTTAYKPYSSRQTPFLRLPYYRIVVLPSRSSPIFILFLLEDLLSRVSPYSIPEERSVVVTLNCAFELIENCASQYTLSARSIFVVYWQPFRSISEQYDTGQTLRHRTQQTPRDKKERKGKFETSRVVFRETQLAPFYSARI